VPCAVLCCVLQVAEWFNQLKARAADVARPRKTAIIKAGPSPEGTPAGDKAVTCQLHYNPTSDYVQVTIKPCSAALCHPPKAAITKVRNQFGLLQLLTLNACQHASAPHCLSAYQIWSRPTQITPSVPKLTPCAAVLPACALQVDKIKCGLSAVVRKVASRPKLPNLPKVSRQPQQAHISEVGEGGEGGEASGKLGPRARSCQWVRQLLKGSVAAAVPAAVCA
jgi:hypothetical protein